MAYDEELAARVRAVLADRDDVEEREMFGGLCFMVAGSMCCGLTKTDFMVRVGHAAFERALAEPFTRPMDFSGRVSRTMVYVEPAGLRSPAALEAWVKRGLAFALSDEAPARRRDAKRSAGPKRRTRG